MSQTWILVDSNGKSYVSAQPGTLGGHRRSRIYGRLNCPAALRAVARGGYVTHRVFFLTEEHAQAAGYRPCALCMPMAYANWKVQQDDDVPESRARLSGRGKRDEERLYHWQNDLVPAGDQQERGKNN